MKLVNQTMYLATVEYLDKNRKPTEIKLYKRALGEPMLNALGEPLRFWCRSSSGIAVLLQKAHGVKNVRITQRKVGVKEYYSSLLDELNAELHADKYWGGYDPCMKYIYIRICEVLQEICIEDIDVEIPELVAYFYNSQKH